MNLREFKNCILGLVILGGFFFACHFGFYLAKTGEKAVDIWLVKTNPDNPGYKSYWEKEYWKTHTKESPVTWIHDDEAEKKWLNLVNQVFDETGKARK